MTEHKPHLAELLANARGDDFLRLVDKAVPQSQIKRMWTG